MPIDFLPGTSNFDPHSRATRFVAHYHKHIYNPEFLLQKLQKEQPDVQLLIVKMWVVQLQYSSEQNHNMKMASTIATLIIELELEDKVTVGEPICWHIGLARLQRNCRSALKNDSNSFYADDPVVFFNNQAKSPPIAPASKQKIANTKGKEKRRRRRRKPAPKIQ